MVLDEQKEFGQFINFMRKSVGWSLSKLAEKIGVHENTLSRWEKGMKIAKHDDQYILENLIRNVIKEEIRTRRVA
ncbi:helix-turn-helix domain-containing protein [Alkalihalophilus pseudofirmus]|uniref:helix-turn-helix domain-containing protein n=1 Tax=Alkalihalophilus pseudofirmus TaxID=79885 RepID=UPI00259B5861|nr:helix-turn-helix domain-containing protein [Alkalihalophilus pseudofirmus]WEG18579.1 helix-turn-helix domain-containing protein [Alkalihalophilus pseudofirmus]